LGVARATLKGLPRATTSVFETAQVSASVLVAWSAVVSAREKGARLAQLTVLALVGGLGRATVARWGPSLETVSGPARGVSWVGV